MCTQCQWIDATGANARQQWEESGVNLKITSKELIQ